MTTKANPTPVKRCRCGCGEQVGGTYRPGHDARHVSQTAARVVAINPRAKTAPAKLEAAFDALGSDSLRAKLGRLLDNRHPAVLNGFGDAGVSVPFTSNPALGSAQ